MNAELKRYRKGRLSFLKGGAGEPILLLHGIPGSAFTWEAVGARLADHFQVIIPDLMGFGQSKIQSNGFYREAQAHGIKRLLEDLDLERLYLGGHDFGAPVALTLMRLVPELTVKGLVLSATNLFTNTQIPLPLRAANIPLFSTLLYKAMVGNKVGLRVMYRAATREKTEASWEKFERHLTPSGIRLTQRIFQRSLADLKTNYQALESMLPDIASPTLILWGANDPFFSSAVGERIHQTIPGSTLIIYEQTGHFVPEERPARVAHDIENFFEGLIESHSSRPATSLTGEIGASGQR